MFDYIQKFKNLPKEIYEKLSDAWAASVIDALEKEYALSLARVIMLIAIKEAPWETLDAYLAREFGLELEKAKKLGADLKKKLFYPVASFFETKSKSGSWPAAPFHPGSSDRFIKNQPGPISVRPNETRQSEERQSKPASFLPVPVKRSLSAVAVAQKSAYPAIKFPPAQKTTGEPNKLKTTPFFFSAEDEEEISALSSHVINYLGNTEAQASTEKTLEQVINEYGNNFTSAEAVNRFRQILKTYFQGIRSRLEVKLTLIKDYRSGGVGIDEKLAEAIMDFIEKRPESKLSKETIIKSPLPLAKAAPVFHPAARDLDYDLAKEIEKRNKEIAEGKKDPIAPKIPAAANEGGENLALTKIAPRLNNVIASAANPITNPVVLPVRTQTKPPPGGKIEGLKAAIRVDQSGRKKIEDVKFTPKILTPVEELRYLDLNTFRRFYKDAPEEAAKKILEKISLLEDEDYGKKLAGIGAWRQSPTFRTYLEMAGEGMADKQTMAGIINIRKAEGKPFLTEAEIHAIMDLNRELRF